MAINSFVILPISLSHSQVDFNAIAIGYMAGLNAGGQSVVL